MFDLNQQEITDTSRLTLNMMTEAGERRIQWKKKNTD